MLAKQSTQLVFGSLKFQRLDRSDKFLFVIKMFLKEMKNHITATTVIAWIHGHFAKEIFHIRHNNSQRSQSIPQII